MVDEQIENTEQKVSKFNSTLAILYRIDALWKQSHYYALSGNLIRLNWILDRVWCELASDADENDEKKMKEFNDNISKLDKVKDKEKLYKELLKKEIFIRKLQDKQGKGVAHEESLEDYWE